ncbi:MAG: alpha-glucosidase C-terminal domain-containing protein [Lentimicrobiaceae bacterium]|nr:alpha-glucosidase C-terminal domain-containing protein [Lentimicrobiaceae bacterium]MCB9023003.1 alpha-glucosidase C-terminal domain-containing protein [Lentimicrobiaceae bacterium]HPG33909.1 alpha-amylase family glycosyl hydrolase [Lentimicrobium sp.]
MNINPLERIRNAWQELYPAEQSVKKLEEFLNELENARNQNKFSPEPEGWYKDAVVYSLYVDFYAGNFSGLIQKLDHLKELGITCLWLLPILDSPMRDAGFDIRDYRNIRAELLGLPAETSMEVKQKAFRDFLDEAHKHGIRVIFDIAMNHTSEEHPWFVESRKGPDNPFRNYYIWNKDTNKYKETRLLFKGMCPSNWEKDGDYYFFHRFFEFQPDLNYKNPDVLIEISRILLFWLSQGLDGFRADAIPYIWKEDGTDCENLPQTHTIIKIFRAVLEYVRPNTLLLAEACQPPHEVVKYFGDGDECHAGYHFPLMPMIFKSLAIQDASPVHEILHPSITPRIASDNQWFTFLRLHDELTLEMVTPEDRAIIHGHYCKDPRWDFRVGEGISARISELLDRNPQKIALAYSIMLTLPGTPIIYYGDEFARLNDESFYENFKKETGKDDTRYFVRGPLNWDAIEAELANPDSLTSQVNKTLKNLLSIRNQWPVFGRGDSQWAQFEIADRTSNQKPVLAFFRSMPGQRVLILNNLSDKQVTINAIDDPNIDYVNLFNGKPVEAPITLPPFGFVWLEA